MTLLRRVTEICRERLPSIRVARITIDSIYDLDKMLQPGIRFGVTVRNTSELIGTPIAYIEYFYFSVDVMDGDERMIIQRMETWRNGTYKAFYRIFYDEVCQTRLGGVDSEELGWRDAYDVFQLNSQIKSELAKKAGVYNLSVNVPAADGYYTMDKDDLETPYAPDYVPVENRKVGLLITFMSYTGWQTWQYKGIEAVIGEVLEEHWLNPSYWKQKDAESVLTKAAIEEKLTGDIETHTHEHLNQLCELVAVQTSDPDVTITPYEQGAKYYNSHTNLIHTLDYSDEVNPWYYAEQPKVGVLYYSLSDESSSYAKLWRYTGTEMLEIPVHPSLALGEESGTAYEGSKGKANADEIASIASKLEGIQENAEVNQNAFSRIKVGSSDIASTTKTDTFELVEGSNITLSSSGKKITISSSYEDTTYGPASDAALGLVKIGYTQNSNNYPLVLDAENKAYVNVPWELSDTSDLVTKSTDQTIIGLKTFDSDVKLTAGKAIELDKVKFLYNPTDAKLDISNLESGQPLNIVTTGGLVLYSTFPAPLDLYDGLVLDETTITRDSSGRLHVIASGSPFDESAMWTALALTSPDTIHLDHLPSIPWSKIISPPSFSLFGHNHDDRYYTETEINNLLANKANWDTAYGWGDHASAGYAVLDGSESQDFSTNNLNVGGYIQVGSARLVYVPEDSDTGTQGYIKIQHADGSTAMHLITTGGQTLYSTGVPAAIEEHLLEAHSGVYNLTVNVPPAEDFYTLSVMSTEAQYAPTHVPVGLRKNGLIITFRSHSEWETWQFTDAYGDFSAAGNWKRIDAFIEQGVYDMDQQSPLLSGQYYQCSNDDDDHYIPSVIPQGSRVPFMKVRYINSYGQRVILRYASSNFAYFNNYDYWDVLKVSDLSSADIEKMLTGLITTHYHDTVQTDRVTPVEAINAPIARSFSLDPHSAGQGYLIITDAYTFSATITIELTMSYLIQDSFYRYVLYIDMRHSGPLQLAITKDGGDIILKGDSTLNMSLEKGIYKIEFIRQMSSGTDLVLYARHDFIPDDVL